MRSMLTLHPQVRVGSNARGHQGRPSGMSSATILSRHTECGRFMRQLRNGRGRLTALAAGRLGPRRDEDQDHCILHIALASGMAKCNNARLGLASLLQKGRRLLAFSAARPRAWTLCLRHIMNYTSKQPQRVEDGRREYSE